MISKARRDAIRRFYRGRRVEIGKSQAEVEALTGLPFTRLSRIENGWAFPREDERASLARVLRVPVERLPTEHHDPVPESVAS